MKPYCLFIFVLLWAACSENRKPENLAVGDPVKDTAYFALDIEVAQRYTKNYQNAAKAFFKKYLKEDTVPIRSYTIRSIDLLESMGLSRKTAVPYEFVRVYLAMDDNNQFRILLTPVTGADFVRGIAGKDVILSGLHTGNIFDDKADEITDGEYMLDFNMPCPNTCNEESKLND